MTNKTPFELEVDYDLPDPDAMPMRDRKVVTQPYDLAIESIVSQINNGVLFLRPLSDRPKFQRQYVWSNTLASRLVESVLLNVPIPPCYLSENEECELDVIDGQQRIYSLYRFLENQFYLSGLEALSEFNGMRYFELPGKEQRRLRTHTLRCVVITNESHPEIKFDVFERLNTNTVPLNAQELRNCVHRGNLNNLLGELSFDPRWLSIRKRKAPDKRLADEEIILRYFAHVILGTDSYRTPLKGWLNEAARQGRKMSEANVDELRSIWSRAIDASLVLFEPSECFRRPGSTAINRALYELQMLTLRDVPVERVVNKRDAFRSAYNRLLRNDEFEDLISRAVDHKKRTIRRFEMWKEEMAGVL